MFIIDMIAGLHGTEKYLYNFIRLIDKQKFSIIIVSLYHKYKVAEEFYDLCIPIIRLPINKLYSPFSFNKYIYLYRIMRKYQIDILETIHRMSDFIGPIIARLAGVKIVISNRRDMGFMRTRIDDFMYRAIDHLVDRIKCNSKAAIKYFSQRDSVSISKFDISYNGVEVRHREISDYDKNNIKKEFGIKEDEIVIGLVGGVKKVKGHIEFIEMAQHLTHVHNNVRFLIVGGGYESGKDEYFDYIKKLSFEKGLDTRIIFTGFVKKVFRFLSILDIAILPSYTEGCSNVLLEYMSAGLPVIATNVGGNPELVAHGVTGFIVPPRDANALIDKAELLLSSKCLRRKLGKTGYETVCKKHSLSCVVTEQMFYYEKLLEDKNKN